MTILRYLLVVMVELSVLTCSSAKVLTATDTSQTIESYGYSSWIYYSSYTYETWNIETEDDLALIEISIDADIEYCAGTCYCDSLQIFDGNHDGETSLGRFCGTFNGKIIQSSGQALYVVFKTDSSVTRRGFKLTYTQIENGIDTWIIVGIGIAAGIVLLSIGFIVCVCYQCKSKTVYPVVVHVGQQHPRVFMTGLPQNNILEDPMYSSVPAPPIYRLPGQVMSTTEMQDITPGR